MKPEELTNEMINLLGKMYYAKFPKGKFLTWLKHENHHLADELKDYKSASTAKEKWDFLLRVYAKIKKPTGQLAESMDELFIDAFKIKLDKTKSTAVIVSDLRNKIRQYFVGEKKEGYLQGYVSSISSAVSETVSSTVNSGLDYLRFRANGVGLAAQDAVDRVGEAVNPFYKIL